MKVIFNMKKVTISVFVLCIALLSFLAGRFYVRDPVAETTKEIPLSAYHVSEQENYDVELSPGAVEISPSLRQTIGVKIAAAEKQPMTYTLRLYGRVVPDEIRTYRVNASTDCWIRQISDVTTGSIVQKDQILAEALAPSYYNAQLTYLIALDNVDRIKTQLGGRTRHQQADLANNQIRVAVQALQNLGITDAQTEELANTRQARPYLQVRSPADGLILNREITLNQWFKAAEEFYTIADIGKVWVYADVYEDEAMHMKPGMKVAVKHAQMGETFDAVVGEVLPLFDPVARTLKVRIDVDNPHYDLRPDMFVDVEIPITLPPSLNISANALIDSGTRKIVYVAVGQGAFEPRIVETGWRLGDRVEITNGLIPGEKIAVSGNFLIDSESQLMSAGLGTSSDIAVDPVSGRLVDREEAGMFELVASYENENFYFSSNKNKEEFRKSPEKYARKSRMNAEKMDLASIPKTDRHWADLLAPDRNKDITKNHSNKIKDTKDAPLNRYSTTPEVVDWNGPEKKGEPPPRWEKGWGGFPGAKYLGIKPDDSPDSEGSNASDEKDKDLHAPEPSGTVEKSIEEELQELEEYLKKTESSNDNQPGSGARP